METQKENSVMFIGVGLVIVALLSIWSLARSYSVSDQVAHVASTTNARLVPLEDMNFQITNLVDGGLVASSTTFLNAIFNGSLAINKIMQGVNQPVTTPNQ